MYSRVHRLLKILTLMQSDYGWNAQRLAEACGTTRRNIYRDLNMLESAGIPYYFDGETRGYRIRGDFFMAPVELTLEEAMAMLCLAERVGGDEQIPFMKPAARALTKIRSQLPVAIRDRLDELEPHVEVRLAAAMSPDGVADVYELVRRAIATRRAVRCAYDSPRHPRKTTTAGREAGLPPEPGAERGHGDHIPGVPSEEPFLFKPYCLFFCQRAWYAIGHHGGRRALRCLKLNRFTAIEPTDRPYAIPDDFSLKGYLGKAWRMIRGERVYRVELHFDAEFAETVADTHWHDTQQVEWLDDGSILFRCEVAGLDEVVWWVLSMGPHCFVRRPRELALRVKKLARATAEQYAGPGDVIVEKTGGAKSRPRRLFPVRR